MCVMVMTTVTTTVMKTGVWMAYLNHVSFDDFCIKETWSVTMNIFRKKKYFLLKSLVKIELSYVFKINMFSTAENCMEKWINL